MINNAAISIHMKVCMDIYFHGFLAKHLELGCMSSLVMQVSFKDLPGCFQSDRAI